ncbi:MAG: tetratricopeptide repeat protein, partial [Saprospiraceae bacterium]|nr:tetratricopeptide repeat protein [Saprospiraceae bacterium]
KIEFHPTGAEAAQPAFQRGLLLLHSFEYDDAAEAFREARQIDPDFAMAYWGEAMCSHHPLWRYQDQEKAKEILAQLGDTP